jgi:glycosyltransferase involved in cell wall biosynthesis
LKILFVLGYPNPFPAAAWTRIGFFADAWAKMGHSVEVLGAFSYKSFQKRGAEKFGQVNIFNIIFNMGLDHPLVFTVNSMFSFIVSTLFLLAKKPDITVVSVPSGNVGLGALTACKLLRAKHVIDYRDEWEDYTINLINSKIGKNFYFAVKKLMASLYFNSHLVVAVTSSYVMLLKDRGVTNVKLVPNGANTRTFRPLINKKENEAFTLIYSGGIGARAPAYYRLDIAVKSIKKLVDKGPKNVRLIIAGDGEVQEVLHLALELGISNNIEYKGTINDKAKLAHLIAEADAGLIPYDDNPLWKNSLPAKFFEYCACGILVIATVYEDSLLAKFIREYEIGITSPPMNEEKLAAAIYKIYRNKLFREASGKRARTLIEEKFDRGKIAEFFLKLVEAI